MTQANSILLSYSRIVAITCLFLSFQIASAQTSSKAGYADPDYIYGQLPDAKQVEASLKTTSDQLNSVIAAKEAEMKKKFTDYVAAEKTMLDAVRTNALAEIEQQQENINQFKKDAQAEFQQKQQQLLRPVYIKIKNAIADVAKENGYTIILSPNIGGGTALLYKLDADNISDRVLKKLGVTPKPAPKTDTPK
jgi:outer membrane protein